MGTTPRGRLLLAAACLLLALGVIFAHHGMSSAPVLAPAADNSADAARPTAATSGDRAGAREPRLASAVLVGELPAGPHLRVRVVDETMTPLGNVPVALATADECEQHVGHIVRSAPGDGIASFALDSPLRTGAGWCVYLAYPGAAASRVRIDPTNPPQDPIDLVARAPGRLVVAIEDPNGAPVNARGDLELFAWPADAPPPPDLRTTTFPFRFHPSRPGEAVVDPIATGLRVSVEAWLDEFAVGAVEGDGPTRAGATTRLTIRLPRYGPVVTGRLLTRAREPLAQARLSGSVASGPEPIARDPAVPFTTDATGRFRFDASGTDVADPNCRRWLEIAAADGVENGRARADLPVPFVQGEYDVGDVVWEAAAPLASGRVVDSAGRPVAGARVHVCRARDEAQDGAGVADVETVVCESGSEGGFAAAGFIEASSLLVFATDADQRESEPVRIAPGARYVTLVVRAVGAIEGSIERAAGLDPRQICLYLRRADPVSPAGRDLHAAIVPPSAGSFRWPRVAAGKVDVVFALGRPSAQPEVLLVVPGVEVNGGSTSRDPRLAHVNLTSRIAKLLVTVVDPSGAPVPTGTVALLSAEEPRTIALAVPLFRGKAELPTMRRTADVEVRAPGFLRERCLGLVAPARIALRPAVAMAVTLEPPLAPPTVPAGVGIELTLQAEADAAGADGQRIVLDQSGTGNLLSTESGWFRVGIELVRTARAGGAGGMDEEIRWQERLDAANRRLAAAFGKPRIAITAGQGEQRLTVPLPASARTVVLEILHGEFGR